MKVWKKWKIYLVLLINVVLLTACSDRRESSQEESIIQSTENECINEVTEVETEESAITEEEVEIKIAGLENEYKFVYLSDLHIIVENDQVTEENLATVRGRIDEFVAGNGTTSAELWSTMPEIINEYQPDGVLLGGDMIDYASDSNIECLKNGTDQLQSPFMYVRADHDYGAWYGELEKDYIRELHHQIDEATRIAVLDYDEFYIVGVDNNTSQISEAALKKLRNIFNEGKPIILMLHVPVNSLLDSSLDELSRTAWGDRNLSWGEGCYYEPDENTAEFLDMIYDKNTPVVEILCGHMHFSWDGNVTDQVKEHVFSPAYTGNIGVINVMPK